VCIILRPLWILEKHFAWKPFIHRLLELSPPCFVLSFRGPWTIKLSEIIRCEPAYENYPRTKSSLLFLIKKTHNNAGALYNSNNKTVQLWLTTLQEVRCPMSFALYPLDKHKCYFVVGSDSFAKNYEVCTVADEAFVSMQLYNSSLFSKYKCSINRFTLHKSYITINLNLINCQHI
jgi:hypothetical protein